MDYKIKDEQGLKEFYDKKARQHCVTRPDRHYEWVLSLLNPPPGKMLLDVACGGGYLLAAASRRGLVTYGIDISPLITQKAKENSPQSDIKSGSGEALPWPDSHFDYVTCLGSLEHFMHPDRGAQEIVRVLSPQAKAAILLPNSYFFEDIIKALIKGRGPTHHQDMERFAAKNEWKALLEDNGLKVEKIYRYNEFTELFVPGTWKLKSLRKYLHHLLRQCYPFNFSYSFVYICIRKT